MIFTAKWEVKPKYAVLQISASWDIYIGMDKKHLSFKVDPGIVKQLKILAAEEEKSMTDLLLEAIQMLFKKYGKKPKK